MEELKKIEEKEAYKLVMEKNGQYIVEAQVPIVYNDSTQIINLRIEDISKIIPIEI